jgi:tRNA ligase
MNEYNPDFKMDLSRGGKGGQKQAQNGNKRQNQDQAQQQRPKKQPKMEYFGVRLDPKRINAILEAMFKDKDPETARMYHHLKQSRRIQPEFHVTLVHRASAPQNQAYWDKLLKLHETFYKPDDAASMYTEPELGKCGVQLERLIWDDRIMCFVVRLEGSATLQTQGEAGTTTEELIFETVNPVAHVTIGTANQNIKPKESNDLLQRWLNEGSNGSGIGEMTVKGHVVLDGSVKGVFGKA